jgi:hypothetical protein
MRLSIHGSRKLSEAGLLDVPDLPPLDFGDDLTAAKGGEKADG